MCSTARSDAPRRPAAAMAWPRPSPRSVAMLLPLLIPMLIAQGANDPRVKQAESEQIVEAIKKAGKPVEYLLFKDEGHGFV
ncbi:MAG: alpha/beta hydrolase family protein, partial [Gemmataceae bacterium]